MKKSLSSFAILSLTILASGPADAALYGRLPATPGGTDYQAYYDDVRDVTWLTDANLAATNDFAVVGINPDGSMFWDTAMAWVNAANTVGYLGFKDWRLPVVDDNGYPGCDSMDTVDLCGTNIDTSYSDLATMFYDILGNKGFSVEYSDWGLQNTGPFDNIQNYMYWTETTVSDEVVWGFNFVNGIQTDLMGMTTISGYAWLVRDGDVLQPVPLPAAAWLFGSGLVGLISVVRRKS